LLIVVPPRAEPGSLLGAGESLDVNGDVGLVADDDLGAVGGQAEVEAVLVKVITGWRSTSKKSAERRWLSRMSLPVLTDDITICAVTEHADGSGPVTICPLTSPNIPRTRLIRCRTAKPTTV
jgi:hypothetical protein